MARPRLGTGTRVRRRRLSLESVGLVFATRVVDEDLAGVPELVLEGLQEANAHALLDSMLTGPSTRGSETGS